MGCPQPVGGHQCQPHTLPPERMGVGQAWPPPARHRVVSWGSGFLGGWGGGSEPLSLHGAVNQGTLCPPGVGSPGCPLSLGGSEGGNQLLPQVRAEPAGHHGVPRQGPRGPGHPGTVSRGGASVSVTPLVPEAGVSPPHR